MGGKCSATYYKNYANIHLIFNSNAAIGNVFVLQYINYLQPRGVEDVRNVYRRACGIHLPYKHSIHLQWSAFEEKHGEKVGLAQNSATLKLI